MPRSLCSSCLLAGLLAFISTADAQFTGKSPGLDIAGSAAVLLNAPSVQKDLDLSPEQITKGKELAQEFQGEAMRAAMSVVGNPFELATLPPAEREAKIKVIKEKAELLGRALTEKYKPKATAILKPEQATRLQQIGWQMAGATAFSDPDLASALKLTDEQKEKLTAVAKEYAEKQAGAAAAGGGDRQATLDKLGELWEERDAAAAKLLNQEQGAKFKDLLGRPFDVKGMRSELVNSLGGGIRAPQIPKGKP